MKRLFAAARKPLANASRRCCSLCVRACGAIWNTSRATDHYAAQASRSNIGIFINQKEKRIPSGGGASAREGLIHSDLLQRFSIPVAERRSSEVKAYLVTCDDNRLVSSSQSLSNQIIESKTLLISLTPEISEHSIRLAETIYAATK